MGANLTWLFGCEESQACCIAFREAGCEAFSCDTEPCSGGHPEWHLQMDVFEAIKLRRWDGAVFFPPCTHLAVSGAKHFEIKRKDGRQQQGIDFFLALTKTYIPHWAIENPIGIMSKNYRKPDQIIQPWQFGDEAQKSTCLWLHNLPLLTPTNIVGKGEFYTSPQGVKMPAWYGDAAVNGKKIAYGSKLMKKIRSTTFPGIAAAMAAQWSNPSNYQTKLF